MPQDETATASPRPWRTERGFERLVFFSDAVVAIAISLLILPVVDIVTADDKLTVGDLFTDHWGELFAFALSFVVIASYWLRHHKMFETINGYTPTIIWINMAWLASIVFLPLPTEMIARADVDDRAVHALYIGTIIVSSVAQSATAIAIRATPSIQEPDAPVVEVEPLVTVMLLIALVVSVTIPSLGMWPLLLLFLTRPVRRGLDRLGIGRGR